MPTQEVTKPIALDETLQSTNTALGTQNGKLDDIKTALQGIGLSNIGNLASLNTTDKTSLVGAVNELVGDIGGKADKVDSATNGNLAGLDGSCGWKRIWQRKFKT